MCGFTKGIERKRYIRSKVDLIVLVIHYDYALVLFGIRSEATHDVVPYHGVLSIITRGIPVMHVVVFHLL